MHNKKSFLIGTGISVLMLLLIMDAKTALAAASEGIELCIRTVIPSLFSFFLLSGILTSCFLGRTVKGSRWLGKLCRIPDGAEYLLLIGLIGGYPVGAQCISSAHRSGAIDKQDAERLLAFCNNAGPAFIFGMTALVLPSTAAPWMIWMIQILCALITGMIMPANAGGGFKAQKPQQISPSQAMRSALTAMASVCGWVVFFRVVISILNRWLLWLIPTDISVVMIGFLELANGCMLLGSVENPVLRFMIAAVTTVFGGFCVYLQTVSVCGQLSSKPFLLGKLLQTILAIPMSAMAAGLLFPGNTQLIYGGIILSLCIIAIVIIRKIKKPTGNSVIHRV